VPSVAEENAPFAALEALAAGAPLVASARGGLPELVGDAGLLVPASDPAALRAALDRLFTDDALHRSLAGRAVARAAVYRLDEHLRRLENLYGASMRNARVARAPSRTAAE
jgi:glycosyltransferase involved in cell wall biosynthesis